jgi:hypothetical protein
MIPIISVGNRRAPVHHGHQGRHAFFTDPRAIPHEDRHGASEVFRDHFQGGEAMNVWGALIEHFLG